MVCISIKEHSLLRSTPILIKKKSKVYVKMFNGVYSLNSYFFYDQHLGNGNFKAMNYDAVCRENIKAWLIMVPKHYKSQKLISAPKERMAFFRCKSKFMNPSERVTGDAWKRKKYIFVSSFKQVLSSSFQFLAVEKFIN